MIKPLLLAATLLTPLAAQAQGVAGPYLAARIAGYSNDYAAAGAYYDTLLGRPGTPTLVLENAVVIYSVLGNFARATEAAALLEGAGRSSQFADGARMVDHLQNGRWDEARALLDEDGVGGALLDGMLDGWIDMAQGDVSEGLAAFETLAETESFANFARIQEAYARATVGDYEGAEAILSGEAHGVLNMSTRNIAAHAQILAQLERVEDARTLLTEANAVTNSPLLQHLATRLEADGTLAYDIVATASDGLAESYFTLAAILAGETSATFTLLNSRAALALRPDHVDALVLTADLLEMQSQYDLANAVLTAVPRDDPSFFGAEIARAEILLASGREEAAVEVLQALTRSNPDRESVWTAFGDTLRRLERFEESGAAYDRAIELAGEIEERDWFLFYVRGIARERTDRWSEAEADFRRALELNPDQPLVLNYLGYGLVEKRIKLDEALDMIERAVAARPDDGYITDSLGWVLYRLGRYEEAVEPMERAVQLRPRDWEINDHLGDVLWAVDRKREAEFQWKRALSLEPDEDAEGRIRRKLEVGLDVVLEEEGGSGPIEAAEE